MRRTQIKELQSLKHMKQSVTLLMAFALMITTAFAAQAGEATGGEDVNPDGDVPFTVQERTTPSQDGETWTLSVVMNQEAIDNGTTFAITTQICLNSGVCDPPVMQEVTVSDDGSTHTAELTPPEDHSYVNWRVKATYSDDSSETYPEGDWYKTWSTCYYDDGSYGGVHAQSNGCDVPGSGEREGILPSAGVVLTLTALMGAALVGTARRD
tara:strand:- start:592 stop:1224 length:633 start_codon:yes stop_codon:yes gene_type:complete